ncbi:hypothetical protein DV737_g3181, partial [Chaetothyriales sp. CBS 132003]
MTASAPLPDLEDGAKEDTGLSILDLVKHSARAIIENLNQCDRLAIVTFSDDAAVIQELIPMSDHNKKKTDNRIGGLQALGITNLWAGIRLGLQLFENTEFASNVQGLFVLTDGLPNHMCPRQGYVNKMKPMLADMARAKARAGATMPTIHTFGFGYDIRSDLMQSIAEIGNGNYAFIPDAGMIGTVFVHAVANLFSTFAVNAVLEVEASSKLELRCSTVFNTERHSETKTVFHLGNLQYGQSRDFILTYGSFRGSIPFIKAKLSYKDRFGRVYNTRLETSSSPSYYLAEDAYAYHVLRSQLCDHLSSFFPISSSTNEHKAFMQDSRSSDKFNLTVASLRRFISIISSHPLASDARIASLIKDLTAPEGEQYGQVSKAVQTSVTTPGSSPTAGEQNYYRKWGRHYLPSLLHAHARQVCNSFKDPGPLMYGQDSPLFIQCRDKLDTAFENLPAPKPTYQRGDSHRYGNVGATCSVNALPPVKMSRYHRKSNPCFSGSSKVLLAGNSLLPIEQLRPGHQVWTQAGARKVVAVLRTDPLPSLTSTQGTMDMIDRGVLCKLDNLWVTPWHPVLVNDTWTFPADVAEEVKVCDQPVYSLLLEQRQHQHQQKMLVADDDDTAHTVMVGGVVAVTLGHGIIGATAVAPALPNKWETAKQQGDVRAHVFFGDWTRVKHALDSLQEDDEGRVRCSGVLRDQKTGLVYGFQPMVADGYAGVEGLARPKIEGVVAGTA